MRDLISLKSVIDEIENSGSIWEFIRQKKVRREDIRITIDGSGEIVKVCLSYSGAMVCLDEEGIIVAHGTDIETVNMPGFFDRYVRENWYNLCVNSCIQNSF